VGQKADNQKLQKTTTVFVQSFTVQNPLSLHVSSLQGVTTAVVANTQDINLRCRKFW